MEPVRAHLAILSVASSSTPGLAMESLVADALTAAGHQVTAFEAVKDTEVAIRAQLVGWVEDPDVDMVIVLGEGTATSRALAPLVEEALPGFADLLRLLAFQEIGAGAMRSVAEAARCGTTFVFVLPANENVVRAAMEQLILPQLDPQAPQNLLDELPRLRDDADVTRVDRAAGPADNIPIPIAKEKTRSGGLPTPRLPAKPAAVATIQRTKSRTGRNVLQREVADPTKPIEVEKLERQLELSKTVGDETKQLPASKPPLRETLPALVAPPAKPPTAPPPIRNLAPTPAMPMPIVKPAKPAPIAKPAAVLIDEAALDEVEPEELAPTIDRERPVVPPPPPAARARPASGLRPPVTAPPRHAPVGEPCAESGSPLPAVVEAAPVDPVPVLVEPVPVEPMLEPVPAEPAPPRARPMSTAPPAPLPKPAPSNELPRGAVVFPPAPRSKMPLVIGVIALVATAAAVGVFFVTRGEREAPRVAETPAVVSDARVVAEAQVVVAADAAAVALVTPDEIEMTADLPTRPVTPKPRVRTDRVPVLPRDPTTPPPPRGSAATVTPDPKPADTDCDETTCVMENYARACCAQFKPTGAEVKPTEADSLTKSQIKQGIDRVRAAVIACGDKVKVTGTVRVSVTVDGEGAVNGVDVQAAPDPALGTCVAGAVRKARFAKTSNGGSFSQPFVF